VSGTAASALAIRPADAADIDAIQRIYADHVLHGSASFEEIPPDAAELERRRREIVGHGLPYFVATVDGAVVGYAYLTRYRPRSAYRFTVEDSIYLAPGNERRGIGGRLLGELIEAATALGMRQMIAVIGDSANRGSIALHERHGFVHAGLFKSVGFKHGRWLDSVLMQRALGPGDRTLPVERD
jgi:phosphinothricin acetyltransferase